MNRLRVDIAALERTLRLAEIAQNKEMNVLNDSYFHAAITLRSRCITILEVELSPRIDRDTALCGLLVSDALIEQNWPDKCRACGDRLDHDDDGSTLCRFCNQCSATPTGKTDANTSTIHAG